MVLLILFMALKGVKALRSLMLCMDELVWEPCWEGSVSIHDLRKLNHGIRT